MMPSCKNRLFYYTLASSDFMEVYVLGPSFSTSQWWLQRWRHTVSVVIARALISRRRFDCYKVLQFSHTQINGWEGSVRIIVPLARSNCYHFLCWASVVFVYLLHADFQQYNNCRYFTIAAAAVYAVTECAMIQFRLRSSQELPSFRRRRLAAHPRWL